MNRHDRTGQKTLAESVTDDAVPLFRQHFADFYGDLSQNEIDALIHAERVELRQIAQRWRLRALLRRMRERIQSEIESDRCREPILS